MRTRFISFPGSLLLLSILFILGFGFVTLFCPISRKSSLLRTITNVHLFSLTTDEINLRRVLYDGISFYVSDVHHQWVVGAERHVMEALRSATVRSIYDPDGTGRECTMVDVGMNDGFFTVMAAVRGCRVWSFEMQPSCIDKAIGAMRVNGVEQRVTLYRGPVSDSNASVSVPHDPAAPCSGARGLLPLDNCGESRELLPWMCPQNSMQALHTFHPFVLAHILPPKIIIDFLKVDTEGHEIQVLRGALPLFREKRVRFAMIETFPPMWTPPYGPAQESVLKQILQYSYKMRCAKSRGEPLECTEKLWFNSDNTTELLGMVKRNRCTDWFVMPRSAQSEREQLTHNGCILIFHHYFINACNNN